MPITAVQSTDKSIVEKIRKLLALADSSRNSHEHEREVAMQAAMDLLAKHNLSLSQVNNSTLDIQPEEVRIKLKLEPWIRRILSASCCLYYTEYYMLSLRNWQGRIEYSPVFVGTAENIAVTIDMAAWLINSIRQESNRIYKDSYERRSFRLGAADRIFSRAVEIVELAEKQAAGASSAASDNSLMVLRNHFEQANKQHLSKNGLKTFKSRAVYLDEDAFADGESFGEQVGLNRQVNGGITRIPQFDGR
jgi:hypothetical protein